MLSTISFLSVLLTAVVLAYRRGYRNAKAEPIWYVMDGYASAKINGEVVVRRLSEEDVKKSFQKAAEYSRTRSLLHPSNDLR